VGDALANILAATGYDVEREYYIQMMQPIRWKPLAVLCGCVAVSLQGEQIAIPENYYQGEYIRDLAIDFLKQPHSQETLASEEHIVPILGLFAAQRILDDIKVDLEDFGVKFNHWSAKKNL